MSEATGFGSCSTADWLGRFGELIKALLLLRQLLLLVMSSEVETSRALMLDSKIMCNERNTIRRDVSTSLDMTFFLCCLAKTVELLA
ncbi:hypothetical protein B0919_19730 [Hymenobacter sp. CRA2]|nr:hypothetical protein B0919_19730 [Hymenobacter sp. CRA2]